MLWIHKILILFRIRNNCLSIGRSRSLYLFIKQIVLTLTLLTWRIWWATISASKWRMGFNLAFKGLIIEAYHLCQLHTKFYPTSCCTGYLHMQRKLLGMINVDSDATVQLLIINYAFFKYLTKNGTKMNPSISSSLTSRKPMILLGGTSCKIFSLSLVSL